MAAYRSAYGPPALAALSKARSARSRDALLDVVRRYGATAAALDALDALATLELERGRPALAVRFCIRRLAHDPAGAGVEPRFLAKLALALSCAGERDRLARLSDTVRALSASDQVESAGKTVLLADLVRSLLDSCESPPKPSGEPLSLPGREQDESSSASSQAPLAGHAVRPGAVLWQVPLVPLRQQSRTAARRPAAKTPPESPSYLPIERDGVLYCQSPSEVRAIDALTGRTLWRIEGTSASFPTAQGFFGGAPDRAGPFLQGTLAPALARDTLLAAFLTNAAGGAQDRTRLSQLGRLDAIPLSPSEREQREDSVAQPSAAGWSIDTRPDPQPPDAQPPLLLRFTAGPAVAGDVVCVPACHSQSDSDALLLGYDSASGRPLWQTRIAQGSLRGARSPLEVPASPPVLVRDGIAYCAPNLGSIAAIDTADGSIIWLARYDTDGLVFRTLKTIADKPAPEDADNPPAPPGRAVGHNDAALPAPSNPPILAGDALIVLPADSESIIALDAATGSVRWRRSRDDGPAAALHLLAAAASRIYLSGSAALCLDAATGRTLWRSVLFDALPLGRGVVARDFMLCPTRGGIAAIDMQAQGRLAEPILWSEWRKAAAVGDDPVLGTSAARRLLVPVGSGNLLSLPGRGQCDGSLDLLIVARNDSLTAFAAPDAEQSLRARIARKPDDARSWLELAALTSSTGKLDGAADAWKHALALLKPDSSAARDARQALVAVYADLARDLEAHESWAQAAAVLADALTLAETKEAVTGTSGASGDVPVTASPALLALRRGIDLEKAGDITAALAVLHDVIRKYPDLELAVPDGLLRDSARGAQPHGLTIRADLLAAVTIADLLRTHGRDAYKEYDGNARSSLMKAEFGNEAQRFDAITGSYPNSLAAADLRLARANRAVAEHRLASAEAELTAVIRLCPGYPEDKLAALRKRLDAAHAAPPVLAPKPAAEAGLLDPAWQAHIKGGRLIPQSVADKSPSLPVRGKGDGEPILVASGKSLRAYDPHTGTLAWRTGTGWLGIKFQPAAVAPPGLSASAVQIAETIPGQPAEQAGVLARDLILSFDGHPVRQTADLVRLCATTPPGKQVDLAVLRADPGGSRRRITLRPVIGDRELAAETVKDPMYISPQEYLRVIGSDGDSILAEVDGVLLCIDRTAGRLLRRTFLDPPGPQHDDEYPERGPTPVLAGGLIIIAASPGGRLIAFDLDGRRRWTAELPGTRLLDFAAWNGRVAALTGTATEDGQTVETLTLSVLDTLTGFEVLQQQVPLRPAVDSGRPEPAEGREFSSSCELIPAGDAILVRAGARLFSAPIVPGVSFLVPETPPGPPVAHAGKPRQWSIDAANLADRPSLSEVFFLEAGPTGRAVVLALLGTRTLIVSDAETGRILWRAEATGAIHRIFTTQPAGRNAPLVFTVHDDAAPGASVACYRLTDGKRLWSTSLDRTARLRERAPWDQLAAEAVPFIGIRGERLFVVHHAVRAPRDNEQPSGQINKPPSPRISVLRLSDGSLLKQLSLPDALGYNVFSGAFRGGILVLFTDSGLIGLFADVKESAPHEEK